MNSNSHLLKNCRIEYLFFQDEVRISSIQTITFPSDTNPLLCSYLYNNNSLVKTSGGFVPVPSGTNMSTLMFSDHAYDSIVQKGNTVYSYTKIINFQGAVIQDTLNNIYFYFDSQNRLVKIVKKNGFFPEGYSVNYLYSDNLITETTDHYSSKRFFYFNEGNLIKVRTEWYDNQGRIDQKNEILFQDFDENPNPFKNMYYVRGAFFRAFSKNNYMSYSICQYCLYNDSTFFLCDTSHYTMPVLYNNDSYPMFGDYE
jgi:hypothetical protein